MVEVRARSNTELVDAAFEIYRQHFPTFFTIAVIAMMPYALQAFFTPSHPAAGVGTSFASVIIVFGLLGVVLSALASGAIISITSDAYLSNNAAESDLESAVRGVFERPVQLVIAVLAKWLIIGVGFICLVIPGFFMVKRYFAVPATLLLEKRGISDALKRSAALSQGNGRRILSILAIIGVLYLIVLIAISLVTSQFVNSRIAEALVHLVVGAVVFPLVDITVTLLYYDLRIRDEGFDIELMEKSLDSGFQGTLVS